MTEVYVIHQERLHRFGEYPYYQVRPYADVITINVLMDGLNLEGKAPADLQVKIQDLSGRTALRSVAELSPVYYLENREAVIDLTLTGE